MLIKYLKEQYGIYKNNKEYKKWIKTQNEIVFDKEWKQTVYNNGLTSAALEIAMRNHLQKTKKFSLKSIGEVPNRHQILVLDVQKTILQKYTGDLDNLVCVQPTVGPVGIVNRLICDKDLCGKYTLKYVDEPIAIKSRKLTTRIMTSNIEESMYDSIVGSIAKIAYSEIFEEILTTLLCVDPSPDSVEIDKETDILALALRANMSANTIARDTMRGAGNVVICGYDSVSFFQECVGFKPNLNETEKYGFMDLVGEINGGMKVYVSNYISGKVLVGYVGAGTIDGVKGDGGAFYSPYQMLMSVGPVIEPDNCETMLGLITRFTLSVFNKDYYRVINLNISGQPEINVGNVMHQHFELRSKKEEFTDEDDNLTDLDSK